MAAVKVIEVIGTSTKGWHDAVDEALKEAAKTVKGITGIDVVGKTALVKDSKITEYRAAVKIAFLIESGRKK
jgi:flavin-binding protein dodecin